jgi:hypothetical protein
MSESASATRGLFTGVANIVRFNPGFFIVGAGVGGMGCLGLFLFADRLPSGVGLLAWITWGIGIWWVFASLLASWWIYDLSALYRWDWLAKRIGAGSRRLVVAHAGFDEVTWSLRQRFPSLEITPVDFHDAGRMTEPSILRARRLCPPLPGTLPVGLDPWRLPDVPEAIVFPLSAHEWRLPEERVRLLRCAKEALVPGGSIYLLEHLRDFWNLLVFGPGFFHFHSRATWEQDWKAAGLDCVERFRVAGFLGGFVLRSSQESKDS